MLQDDERDRLIHRHEIHTYTSGVRQAVITVVVIVTVAVIATLLTIVGSDTHKLAMRAPFAANHPSGAGLKSASIVRDCEVLIVGNDPAGLAIARALSARLGTRLCLLNDVSGDTAYLGGDQVLSEHVGMRCLFNALNVTGYVRGTSARRRQSRALILPNGHVIASACAECHGQSIEPALAATFAGRLPPAVCSNMTEDATTCSPANDLLEHVLTGVRAATTPLPTTTDRTYTAVLDNSISGGAAARAYLALTSALGQTLLADDLRAQQSAAAHALLDADWQRASTFFVRPAETDVWARVLAEVVANGARILPPSHATEFDVDTKDTTYPYRVYTSDAHVIHAQRVVWAVSPTRFQSTVGGAFGRALADTAVMRALDTRPACEVTLHFPGAPWWPLADTPTEPFCQDTWCIDYTLGSNDNAGNGVEWHLLDTTRGWRVRYIPLPSDPVNTTVVRVIPESCDAFRDAALRDTLGAEVGTALGAPVAPTSVTWTYDVHGRVLLRANDADVRASSVAPWARAPAGDGHRVCFAGAAYDWPTGANGWDEGALRSAAACFDGPALGNYTDTVDTSAWFKCGDQLDAQKPASVSNRCLWLNTEQPLTTGPNYCPQGAVTAAAVMAAERPSLRDRKRVPDYGGPSV